MTIGRKVWTSSDDKNMDKHELHDWDLTDGDPNMEKTGEAWGDSNHNQRDERVEGTVRRSTLRISQVFLLLSSSTTNAYYKSVDNQRPSRQSGWG